MTKRTRWIQHSYDKSIIESFSKEFNISHTGVKILLNRGIDTLDKADQFINVKLKNLYDPFLLTNMDKAIDRILLAFKRNELIYGFGDYDVDGLTSLSILCLFIDEVHHNIKYLVPNRQSSGYGLNKDAISQMHANKASLIITVDCGISNFDEIEYANSLGIDVIVIDHHQVPENLPPAVAILNPYLVGDKFPFPHMAAVGVTFNMLVALRKTLRERGFFNDREEIDLKKYLDIVSIGTIADIVPLFDENRIFTKIGFEQMLHTSHVGLRALMNESEVTAPIDSVKIGFKIAPRINAAGRMSDATKVVDLFTTKDPVVAQKIAKDLNDENIKRQEIEHKIYLEIVSLIENKKTKNTAIILAHETWHPGVIGIVAAKIVERYNRPTFLFSISDGIGRGSARSINGFDLYLNLSEIKDLFINYGGHKYAAGLSINMNNYKMFKSKIQTASNKFFEDPENLVHELLVDDILESKDISIQLFNEMQLFAPYGHKNPEPIFGLKNLFPIDAKIIAERHLKLHITANHTHFNAIGFNMSHLMKQTSSYIDVLFNLQINEFNGISKLQLNLKDLKQHDKKNFI